MLQLLFFIGFDGGNDPIRRARARSDRARPATIRRAPVREFVGAALVGDRLAGTRLAIDFMARTASRVTVIADLFAAAQQYVADLWHAGLATSEDEYRVAMCIQTALGTLPPSSRAPGPAVSTALLTTMPREAHHLGLLLMAVALEDDGWTVQFAPQMEVEEMVETVRRQGLGLTAISATYDAGGAAARLASAVMELHRAGARVLVGGSLFERVPLLVREIGADAAAQDPRLAIALARRLVRAPRRLRRVSVSLDR